MESEAVTSSRYADKNCRSYKVSPQSNLHYNEFIENIKNVMSK